MSASQFNFQAGFESGLYQISASNAAAGAGGASTITTNEDEAAAANTGPTRYRERIVAEKKRRRVEQRERQEVKRSTMYKEPNSQSGMLFLYSPLNRKTNLFSP